MALSDSLTEKKKYNSIIKKTYWFKQVLKPLWLIKISNKEILENLINWLIVLPGWFIIETDLLWEELNNELLNFTITKKVKSDLLIWFDFILCDDELENLNSYMQKWITPIIIKKNHLSWLLSDFDPMKSEWNSFTYETNDSWSMFYSIVRYMENHKFPYDNRNLVKNVLAA